MDQTPAETVLEMVTTMETCADDGDWGRLSQHGLLRFQRDAGAVDTGYWTTFTCWDVYDALQARGIISGFVDSAAASQLC